MKKTHLKSIVHKETGAYGVKLLEGDDEEFSLAVVYRGSWATGRYVKLWLEPDVDDPTRAEMKDWFKEAVRGDQDIEELLAEAGFDQYTNPRNKQRPVRIRIES